MLVALLIYFPRCWVLNQSHWSQDMKELMPDVHKTFHHFTGMVGLGFGRLGAPVVPYHLNLGCSSGLLVETDITWLSIKTGQPIRGCDLPFPWGFYRPWPRGTLWWSCQNMWRLALPPPHPYGSTHHEEQKQWNMYGHNILDMYILIFMYNIYYYLLLYTSISTWDQLAYVWPLSTWAYQFPYLPKQQKGGNRFFRHIDSII